MAARVKDLFNAALDLEPEARAAFLDRECDSDPELRKRLDILLRAHDAPDSVVAGPLAAGRTGTPAPDESGTGAFDPDATAAYDPNPDAGTVIAGKYKLVDLIGEGGMGRVWMGQQFEPVRRPVAVKLIKKRWRKEAERLENQGRSSLRQRF